MKYCCEILNNKIVSIFCAEHEGKEIQEEIIKNGGIFIDENLHKYLTGLTGVRTVDKESLNKYTSNNLNDFIFGVEAKECFRVIKEENITLIPNAINILEKENADLLKDSALKDFKIESLQNDIADIIKEVAKGGQI
ncbi:hypothetical protein JCM1393_21650 [Clostridium carnis]